MIEEIASINAPQTGYCHNLIRRSLDAGKERPENKELRIIKKLKEEREKVQPVYNSKGKLIEYDKYERHLDVKV